MKTAISWILQLIVVGVLGLGIFFYFFLPDAKGPIDEAAGLVEEATLNLPVETLNPQDITPEYTSLAKVEEWQSSTLATQASGRVIWTCECFEEGRRVEAGTLLLQIDATSYARDVVEREKDLINASAMLAEAKAETEQARENYARLDLGEPNDIALKIPELKAAGLSVTSAEAALEIAQSNLEETNIVAPYTGIISSVGASTGDLISNGANLGTIIGTNLFKVRFPILENQLFLAQVGSEIRIETTTEPVIVKTGIVQAIDIDIDQSTRLNSVIVAVQNPLDGQILRLGRFVNGTFSGVIVDNVFAIPLVALDNEMNYYQVGEDSRLIAVSAQPVYRDFRAIYIKADGETQLQIVTGNVLGLRTGMLVQGYEK